MHLLGHLLDQLSDQYSSLSSCYASESLTGSKGTGYAPSQPLAGPAQRAHFSAT
jgi:hypothetical protein